MDKYGTEYENKNRIERLRRNLYSRKAPDILDLGRSEPKIAPTEPRRDASWGSATQGENRFDMLASKISHGAVKNRSFAKKLFSISLGIFALSIIAALSIFFGGGNLISSKNVDIQVSGPVSVGGGQESSFDISVVNKNNTDLASVKLTLDYPKGVRRAGNLGEDLTTESFNLGTIKSGQVGKQSVKVFIFGEKDEVKDFKLVADYKVTNSNAKFFKEKIYSIAISSSPLIVAATYPKEVNSNQDIAFAVEVTPNSTDLPKELLLNVVYPFGFSLKSSEPAAAYGNNTWKFASLKQGEKKTVNIYGKIAGQDNEERIFKITAGTPSQDDARKIGVPIMSVDESILVKKPFLGLDFKIEGQSGDFVSKGASAINSNLRLQNNLPEKIFNVQITAALSGSAFSGNSVTVGQNGFFRSTDNTVFWDKRAIQNLGALDPGETAEVYWSLSPLSYQSLPKNANPEINISIKTEGDRILSSGETEHVVSTVDRLIRLASDLSLSGRLVRIGNSITNSGPIPPKANQMSTYTVVWSISNSFNNVSNVVVRATLPPYIEWTGLKNPSTEKITYNPDTHEVVWSPGTIPNGTGLVGTASREAAFQISFLPSTSQVGREAVILNEARISGIDKVTGTQLESAIQPLTSKFSDSTYRTDDEKVVP